MQQSVPEYGQDFIHEVCIPHNRAKAILEKLYSFGTHVAFRQNGECFADAKQQGR